MKTIIIYLAGMGLLMNPCKGNTQYAMKDSSVNPFQTALIKKVYQNDTLLDNIQQKVNNAFIEVNITQTDSALISLEQALMSLNEKGSNTIVIYWYSYACFYHSIFFMTQQNKKESEKVLDAGIKQLNDVNPKSSEHLALLALMEGFSIQFAPGMEAPSIAGRSMNHAEEAVQLDSTNLRAYYVLGSNDFYTPEQYGGGENAERYFVKAIGLNDQSVKNPYLPSWGKNLAYEMLIRFYIKHNRFDEAKKYYQQAIALFPGDYMINKLSAELINH